MIEPTTVDMIKYPFIKESGEYLKSQPFGLEDFGRDPDLEGIVTRAHERIIAARQGLPSKPKVQDLHNNNIALQNEIFSFLIAVVLVKLSRVRMLASKFSMQEAISAERLLEKDLRPVGDVGGGIMIDAQQQHTRSLAVRIIHDISGVQISKPAESSFGENKIVYDDDWLVEIPDYLRRAVHFHEREWKLVNRRVGGGRVYLTSHETVRIIRKELEHFIRQRIDAIQVPQMFPQFEEPVAELVRWGRENQPVIVETSEYPPCIKHAIKVLESGENLPHSGRFMLAAYLIQKGQSVNEIAPLFKNAPDYNQKTTLYQLNSIAGETGSRVTYLCPSCQKIKGNDLCFEAPECSGIVNPVQFGRKRA